MRSNCFLLALLLVGILPELGPLVAQSGPWFKLVSVKVIGSSRYEESEIVRATGLKLAELVTPDTLKEAAGRLGRRICGSQLPISHSRRGADG
jgi:hypothetical protein